eukprot:630773_1
MKFRKIKLKQYIFMSLFDSLNSVWILTSLFPISYIAYYRRYFTTKLPHWNYGYYPAFKPIHYLLNKMYFQYHGKHSCFVHTHSESTSVQQNVILNQQFASKLNKKSVRIVCISDTHELHRQLSIPNGDVLIHCGDILFANSHNYSEEQSIKKMHDFNTWLGTLPHKYKIIIAGNHDYCFEKIGRTRCEQILTNAIYLINDPFTLTFEDTRNINLFCSAYSIPNSAFSPNKAFQSPRDTIADKIWSQIPNDIDILVTHHMPHTYLDNGKGCTALLNILKDRCTRCKYSIFGHWHSTYGVQFGQDNGKEFSNEHRQNICFINASSVDSFICAIHPPIVFDYHF